MTKEDKEVLITKAILLGYVFKYFGPVYGWAIGMPTSGDCNRWLSYYLKDGELTWYWEHPHEAARAALKDAGIKL